MAKAVRLTAGAVRLTAGALGALALAAAWLAVPTGASAMMNLNTVDQGTAPAAPADTDLTTAVKDIKAGKYAAAIPLLRKVVDRDPRNADAWNGLGFASRKLGKYADALDAYEKALAIDPNHRGANEYLGELYLETGDMAKARERLARLDKLCPSGCPEATALRRAINAKHAAQ